MRAVIMAGGRGERLRPLTDTCPKPLLPVAGRPVLDRLLEKLSEAGIQDVTLAVGYLGQMIEDYVGDGARWGVRADYVRQVEPMGTAGALSLLADRHQPVLVVNGDKIVERASDIQALAARDYLNAVATVPFQVPYGIVGTNGPPYLGAYRFVEKPVLDACAGLYAVNPALLARVSGRMDMPELLRYSGVLAVPMQGYVLDIGTPATYGAACARLSNA